MLTIVKYQRTMTVLFIHVTIILRNLSFQSPKILAFAVFGSVSILSVFAFSLSFYINIFVLNCVWL